MQFIRKRPRLDALLNQQRANTLAWGRRFYIVLLAILGIGLVNYFIGDAVFLRADGILLTDRQIVAATFPAKVAAVHVKEGDVVAKGAVLVELQSAEMLKEIADLGLRNADLAVREEQLRPLHDGQLPSTWNAFAKATGWRLNRGVPISTHPAWR